MSEKPKKKTEKVVTTAERLRSLIKSCRDIMRKDKGLNGDLDRLPMLTWILFLKFLDDLNRIRRPRPCWPGSAIGRPSSGRTAGAIGPDGKTA